MIDRDALQAIGVDGSVIESRRRLDGDRGVAFVARLPQLVDDWQRRFGLGGARMMPGGALSAVFACRRRSDGQAVVLKLTAPHAQSARAEAAALSIWGGVGACSLLAASDDARALLLESIDPGVPVTPSGDDGADARWAAALMALLRRPSAAVLTLVPDGAARLDWRFGRARQWLAEGRAAAALTVAELDAGARAAGVLQATCTRELCHGDLLNKNILLDGFDRPRAIDPMPCIGDPCMDAGFWALHHRPGSEVAERCELVARAAGLDGRRVRRWALAFASVEAVLDTTAGRAEGHLQTLRMQDQLHAG